MAIKYFVFLITILANTDCLVQSDFSRNRSFDMAGIQVSSFYSECALFENVIKRE